MSTSQGTMIPVRRKRRSDDPPPTNAKKTRREKAAGEPGSFDRAQIYMCTKLAVGNLNMTLVRHNTSFVYDGRKKELVVSFEVIATEEDKDSVNEADDFIDGPNAYHITLRVPDMIGLTQISKEYLDGETYPIINITTEGSVASDDISCEPFFIHGEDGRLGSITAELFPNTRSSAYNELIADMQQSGVQVKFLSKRDEAALRRNPFGKSHPNLNTMHALNAMLRRDITIARLHSGLHKLRSTMLQQTTAKNAEIDVLKKDLEDAVQRRKKAERSQWADAFSESARVLEAEVAELRQQLKASGEEIELLKKANTWESENEEEMQEMQWVERFL